MIYILTAIFLWSFLGLVIRFSGMPVSVLIFFSCLISAVIIGLSFLKKERRATLPSFRALSSLLVLGPVNLVNTFCFYYAYQNTTVANAVLTHYTAPIFVAMLAPIFLKEKLSARAIFSVVIATLGLWIMLGVSFEQFSGLLFAGDKNTAGIVAGVSSGLAYAVLIVILRVLSPSFDPVVMTFFQNIVVALILLPFVEIPANILSAWWAFIIMGIVHSIIAPIFYFRGMRDVSAYGASILGYLEPVSVIILGILFLSEPVGGPTLIGGLMIIVSGYLTLRQ